MIKSISRAIKRQITNRFAYIIIAFLISVIAPLFTHIVASAASPYDNFVISDTLEVSDGVNSYDISSNFTSIILEDDNIDSSVKSSLQNALSSEIGGWSVTQRNDKGNKYVIYKWNVDRSDIITSFKTSQPLYNYLNAWGQDGYCILQYDQFGVLPTCYLSSGSTHEIVSTPLNNNPNNYFGAYIINYDIPYPPEYNGPLLPDTAPGSKETITPTISATVTDKTVIFKLDELPFTPCSVNYMISYSEKPNNDYGESTLETLKNGWLQIFSGDITLEEWRKGGQTYDARVIDFKHNANPNDEIIVNAPDHGSILVFAVVNTEWQGAPRQLCGDNGNPDDFNYTLQPRLQFINIDGTNYAIDGTKCDPNSITCTTTNAKSDLMDCFTDSFPFINLTECKNAVAVLGERLSFNKLQFGNSWIFSPQCQNLGELGDWIGVQNKTVCPHFSHTVRSTIDPFVAFILGLIVVAFIARNTGKDF